MVIENKLLYGSYMRHELAQGFKLSLSDESVPSAWVRPLSQAVDLTLLGYGGMSDLLVAAAEKLFEEHDIIAQVLCPGQIYPFSVVGLLPALGAAPRLLIVEEGQGFAGFGAELIAQLAELASALAPHARRLAPPPDIIPAGAALEKAMLPGLEAIIAKARELCV